jgi:hypothetical protein
MNVQPLELIIRWKSAEIARTRVEADLEDNRELRRHFVAAIEREHQRDDSWIADYSMDVHQAGSRYPLFEFTATPGGH